MNETCISLPPRKRIRYIKASQKRISISSYRLLGDIEQKWETRTFRATPTSVSLSTLTYLEETRKRDSLNLRLPEEIEKPFLEHYFNTSLRQVRLGILIGTILVVIFAVDDLTMEPAKKDIALKIRFLGMVPLLLMAIYMTYLPVFKKYFQILLCTVHMIIGFGLPFCMNIINAHGGTIWVESKKPSGSIFCIELPDNHHHKTGAITT
jgi:hypothetical protein